MQRQDIEKSEYTYMLQSLCILLYIHAYINSEITETFSEWYASRPELNTLFTSLSNEYISYDANVVTAIDKYKRINGKVLSPKSILLYDHFPGCVNTHIPQPFKDASPNFRDYDPVSPLSVDIPPVFGTGIPTEQGISVVMEYIHATYPQYKKVLWLNLREEPVLYINNYPYVLRDIYDPYHNLIYTGINMKRLEEIEITLKNDIIMEMKANNSTFCIYREDDEANLVQNPIFTTRDNIHTPKEAYELYNSIHANSQDPSSLPAIIYRRIPVSDEQAPLIPALSRYLKVLKDNLDCPTICNCQMGRGRTSTAMIISVLSHVFYRNSWKSYTPLDTPQKEDFFNTPLSPIPSSVQNSEDEKYSTYRFSVILSSLLSLLRNGRTVKGRIDRVIIECSKMQNIKDVIFVYFKLLTDPFCSVSKKDRYLVSVTHFFKRYIALLILGGYFETHTPDTLESFEEWMVASQPIQSLFDSIV
ncbi:hypothetical protein WA158_002353 [Blastocystis sp. Blastoise]